MFPVVCSIEPLRLCVLGKPNILCLPAAPNLDWLFCCYFFTLLSEKKLIYALMMLIKLWRRNQWFSLIVLFAEGKFIWFWLLDEPEPHSISGVIVSWIFACSQKFWTNTKLFLTLNQKIQFAQTTDSFSLSLLSKPCLANYWQTAKKYFSFLWFQVSLLFFFAFSNFLNAHIKQFFRKTFY